MGSGGLKWLKSPAAIRQCGWEQEVRACQNKLQRRFDSVVQISVLGAAAAVSGEAIYKDRCAACHDSGSPRVPPREELKKLSVARIMRAMDFGLMYNVATKLRQDEREAVAAFLGVPGGS